MDGRRLRHAQRRPELVGLAADYLLRHGLADVSLRPLAAALGLTHRAVLHHFGTKEALLVEAVQEVRRREQERVRLAPEALAGDPVDLLWTVWRRVSAPVHLPFARLHFELQAAADRRPETYGRFLDDLVGSWIELITTLLVHRGVPGDDAPALATATYATIRGLQLDLLATGDRERVDAAFAQLARWLGDRVVATAPTPPPER